MKKVIKNPDEEDDEDLDDEDIGIDEDEDLDAIRLKPKGVLKVNE